MTAPETNTGWPRQVTFEVEVSRVESVTITLPAGYTLDDCSSKRLHRWPDPVMEAIEEAVTAKLLDFHGHQLVHIIT